MADSLPYYKGLVRNTLLPPCALSYEDLRRLFAELEPKALEVSNRWLGNYPKKPEDSAENDAQQRDDFRKNTGLVVIVRGGGGEALVLKSKEQLEKALLPDSVQEITFDIGFAFQAIMNQSSPERVRVQFDLSPPPLIFGYNPWEERTPNRSFIEISGTDEAWVESVYQLVLKFVNYRSKRWGWLHSRLTYNIAIYLLGWPAAFWTAYRVDSALAEFLAGLPNGLRVALDVYLFLLSLVLVRLVAGAVRLIFPLVELKGSKTDRRRGWLGLVVLGLLTALIYDLIKAL